MNQRDPEFVCDFCGQSYGRKPCEDVAVWHVGECGVCQDESISVTAVHSFGGLYDHWREHD